MTAATRGATRGAAVVDLSDLGSMLASLEEELFRALRGRDLLQGSVEMRPVVTPRIVPVAGPPARQPAPRFKRLRVRVEQV